MEEGSLGMPVADVLDYVVWETQFSVGREPGPLGEGVLDTSLKCTALCLTVAVT